jgi:hypothetical protein
LNNFIQNLQQEFVFKKDFKRDLKKKRIKFSERSFSHFNFSVSLKHEYGKGIYQVNFA